MSSSNNFFTFLFNSSQSFLYSFILYELTSLLQPTVNDNEKSILSKSSADNSNVTDFLSESKILPFKDLILFNSYIYIYSSVRII